MKGEQNLRRNIYCSLDFIVRNGNVEDEEDETYLQSPDSWIGGFGRYTWFVKLTGIKPSIASSRFWEKMLEEEKNKVMKLIEYTDKSWAIVDQKDG